MNERTWRIVTPEAVALDLEAAGLASRILAAIIDVMVLQVVLSSILTVVGAGSGLIETSSTFVAVAMIVLFFLMLLAWPVAWEMATKGRSVGKYALGLRVVTVEGAPIRFRQALVRGLVGVFELFLTFGGIALLVAMGSYRFRRVGDHLAGTVVIRERSATPEAYAIRFVPLPGWEPFAQALDVSRLTPDHHRLVRSFLVRAPGLDPQVRVLLGNQILDLVAASTSLPNDARQALSAYDPTLPLTAVAAAYQRRFSPDPFATSPWLPGSTPTVPAL